MLARLNQNSSAITPVATVVGMIVAAIFSLFAALQWLATKRQADVTRHIFEASHRQYVTTEAQEPTDAETNGRLSFNLVFRNEGTVPADITDFDVRGTLMTLTVGSNR